MPHRIPSGRNRLWQVSQYVDVVSWDSYPIGTIALAIATTAMKSAYVHDQYWSLKKQPF